jgi:cobalamin biosynthesis Mg chelatase CobN
MEEQLLKEYVATYLNPKYNRNWDVVNSKFPELSGVDKQLLKEYVSTYLNPTYKGVPRTIFS